MSPNAGSGERSTVAVVGSGVAGLTAAYLLQRRYDVRLFEADDRLGGHAHTHDISTPHGVRGLDTGFLVHNTKTYPSLMKLFNELGVATQDSEMSMSVRCDGCGLEYAGARGVSGLFAQRRSIARPRYLAMLAQVKRFHASARKILAAGSPDDLTLETFIEQNHFSRYFAHHFLLPLVSAVWSCGFDGARNYPARYLFAFLDHHGMLAVTGSPQWRTVVGGSRTYVDRAVKELSAVHTATPVRSVTRHLDGVDVRDDADELHRVDHVVLAAHPDQALGLLADPTPEESRLLGAFEYLTSETVLHTDASVLPRTPAARASWNYLMDTCNSDDRQVNVTYNLNRLQRIDSDVDYLVTLNADGRVDPSTVLAEMTYAHPTYTPASVAAQREVGGLNTGRTAFAGAWQGWGFHEDGCASGVRAAAVLGVDW